MIPCDLIDLLLHTIISCPNMKKIVNNYMIRDRQSKKNKYFVT